MPTLSEYAKLERDLVAKGIFEGILTADALMPLLKFKSFEGNAFVYNRESALPTAAPHTVGDTWEDSEPTYTKKNAELAIIGVQSPLDLYAHETRSSVQSQESVLLSIMTKALTRKMADMVINGEPESTTAEIEGLDSLSRAETRMMAMDDGNVDGPGTAETVLDLDRLDQMIDLVDDGMSKPDALIMNTTMRRKLTALSRTSTNGVTMNEAEMFGHKVTTYDGIPIIVNNHIANDQQFNDAATWPSSKATSIYAVNFGEEKQGYTILHNGPVLEPRVRRLGTKFDAEQTVYRMVVYIQSIVFSAHQIAALGGIDSTL